MNAIRRRLATVGQIAHEASAVLREVRGGRAGALADLIVYRLLGLGLVRPNARLRCVTMANGSVLRYRRNRGDIQTFREVWLDGCYRVPAEAKTATVLDLGANIGLASVWLAARYPVERLLAVEPDPENAKLARLNLAANGVNGSVVEAAVSPESGRTRLSRGDEANVGRSHTARGIEVSAITPAELIGRLGGAVDLVKMDIEGAEERLVAEDASWLGQVGWLVTELHPGLIDYPDVVRRIEGAGFTRIAPDALWRGSMDMFHPSAAAGEAIR